MAGSEGDSLIWREAVDWLMREHEKPLDVATRQALIAWLKENPAHHAAYEEASRLWLLTGLIPLSCQDD